MEIVKYQVDAFAENLFEGNPAVVCPLVEFLEDDLMQKIAMEHNLSETAFIVDRDGTYDIRWFTPKHEVKLCGHATLASAHVIYEQLGHQEEEIIFQSMHRGQLKVTKKNDLLELDFPMGSYKKSKYTKEEIEKAMGISINEFYDADEDILIVLESEKDLASFVPDFNQMMNIPIRGFIITSRSKDYDFVSRFFAPRFGVNEDPVTGSAHTRLIAYWHKQLNKKYMIARQISERGGTVYCTYNGERAMMAGKAVLYSEGKIIIS